MQTAFRPLPVLHYRVIVTSNVEKHEALRYGQLPNVVWAHEGAVLDARRVVHQIARNTRSLCARDERMKAALFGCSAATSIQSTQTRNFVGNFVVDECDSGGRQVRRSTPR